MAPASALSTPYSWPLDFTCRVTGGDLLGLFEMVETILAKETVAFFCSRVVTATGLISWEALWSIPFRSWSGGWLNQGFGVSEALRSLQHKNGSFFGSFLLLPCIMASMSLITNPGSYLIPWCWGWRSGSSIMLPNKLGLFPRSQIPTPTSPEPPPRHHRPALRELGFATSCTSTSATWQGVVVEKSHFMLASITLSCVVCLSGCSRSLHVIVNNNSKLLITKDQVPAVLGPQLVSIPSLDSFCLFPNG